MITQPSKQTQTIHLYAALMEEVKIRIACINIALKSAGSMPGQITHEFCYLQLRMLCELIALGCLVAHGDIEETTRLRKEYSVEKIIDRLQQLHPEFYPWPVRQLPSKESGRYSLVGINEGFLTKRELLALNGKCGDVLHRGSLKHC